MTTLVTTLLTTLLTALVTLLDAATEVTENAANMLTEAQQYILSQEISIYFVILTAFGLSIFINLRLISKDNYEYKNFWPLFKISCVISLFMGIFILTIYFLTVLCIKNGKTLNENAFITFRTLNMTFAIFSSFTAIPYIRFLFNRLVKLIIKSKSSNKDTNKKAKQAKFKQTKSKSSKKFTIIDI